MTKQELIEKLNAIPGNPQVVLEVGDPEGVLDKFYEPVDFVEVTKVHKSSMRDGYLEGLESDESAIELRVSWGRIE